MAKKSGGSGFMVKGAASTDAMGKKSPGAGKKMAKGKSSGKKMGLKK